MKFSQRIGKTPVRTALQIESIDNDLKNRLWNIVLDYFQSLNNISSHDVYSESDRVKILFFIWRDFFGYTTDTISKNFLGNVITENVIRTIREWFFDQALWYEVYDFIEFITLKTPILRFSFNQVLEKEISGYRIINGKVTQITSEQEIQSIQGALDNTDEWQSVNTHLKAALDFLADKKSPDYRNSIKESISAVEATCIKITGDPKATLGKALLEIERNHGLDGGLKGAFNALYGYTSNAGGIRHALIDGESSPSFEEAKFMLVSCSAFINYLKAKLKL